MCNNVDPFDRLCSSWFFFFCRKFSIRKCLFITWTVKFSVNFSKMPFISIHCSCQITTDVLNWINVIGMEPTFFFRFALNSAFHCVVGKSFCNLQSRSLIDKRWSLRVPLLDAEFISPERILIRDWPHREQKISLCQNRGLPKGRWAKPLYFRANRDSWSSIFQDFRFPDITEKNTSCHWSFAFSR